MIIADDEFRFSRKFAFYTASGFLISLPKPDYFLGLTSQNVGDETYLIFIFKIIKLSWNRHFPVFRELDYVGLTSLFVYRACRWLCKWEYSLLLKYNERFFRKKAQFVVVIQGISTSAMISQQYVGWNVKQYNKLGDARGFKKGYYCKN